MKKTSAGKLLQNMAMANMIGKTGAYTVDGEVFDVQPWETPLPIEQTDAELAELVSWWNDFSDNERKQFKGIETVVRETPKIGRNDRCHCGSGKKYKHCCEELDRG